MMPKTFSAILAGMLVLSFLACSEIEFRGNTPTSPSTKRERSSSAKGEGSSATKGEGEARSHPVEENEEVKDPPTECGEIGCPEYQEPAVTQLTYCDESFGPGAFEGSNGFLILQGSEGNNTLVIETIPGELNSVFALVDGGKKKKFTDFVRIVGCGFAGDDEFRIVFTDDRGYYSKQRITQFDGSSGDDKLSFAYSENQNSLRIRELGPCGGQGTEEAIECWNVSDLLGADTGAESITAKYLIDTVSRD